MKNLLKYKQFENNSQIPLTENEKEVKDDLEFILTDLTDLGVHFELSGKNIFMLDLEGWYRNTGVERGYTYTDYLCLRLYPDYTQLEEIIEILKDCKRYTERQGWKSSVTIEEGVRIIKSNLDQIVELYNTNKSAYPGRKLYGSISIFFYKIEKLDL